MSDLSFFPTAVMIARAHAAPILAKVAERGTFEDDAYLEGRRLNREAYVEGRREAEQMDRNRET